MPISAVPQDGVPTATMETVRNSIKCSPLQAENLDLTGISW